MDVGDKLFGCIDSPVQRKNEASGLTLAEGLR
jgi:hypothetical protein